MSREFFPARHAHIGDRVDLLEEWAAEFSGRQPVDLTAGVQSLADVPLSSVGGSGSSGGGSGALNGDVTGPATANTVNRLVNKSLSGTPATGNVYAYDGTKWVAQSFVGGAWGVGAAPLASLYVTRVAAANPANPTYEQIVAVADTAMAAGTEVNDVLWDLSRTLQFATGALTTQRAVLIKAPTYSFVAASTITTAATLTIDKAPVAGANATITNAYALWVPQGASRFGGDVSLAEGVNLIAGTTTGTKLGTSATQKLSAFGVAPVVQQVGASAAAIAAILDPNAAAAVGSLQNALAALGWVTAPL